MAGPLGVERRRLHAQRSEGKLKQLIVMDKTISRDPRFRSGHAVFYFKG